MRLIKAEIKKKQRLDIHILAVTHSHKKRTINSQSIYKNIDQIL